MAGHKIGPCTLAIACKSGCPRPPHRGREQSTTCIPFALPSVCPPLIPLSSRRLEDLPRTFPTLAFFSEASGKSFVGLYLAFGSICKQGQAVLLCQGGPLHEDCARILEVVRVLSLLCPATIVIACRPCRHTLSSGQISAMCRACMRLRWLKCDRCIQTRGDGLGRFVEQWFEELFGGHAASLLAAVRVLCVLAA